MGRLYKKNRRIKYLKIVLIIFSLFLMLLLAKVLYKKRDLFLHPVLDFVNTHRYLHREELLKCRLIRKVYPKSPILAGYVLQITKDGQLKKVWILNIKRTSNFLYEFTKYKANKILFFKGSDWITLYNTDTTVAQVVTLPHYAKHESVKATKFIIRQLVYNTGVLPNFVVVIDEDFKLTASTVNIKSSSDILELLKDHQATHIKPVLDNLYVLEDGTEVYFNNYRSFSLQYNNFNRLDFLSDEHAFIEVYNSTGVNGYGAFCSHILRQYGIDVSRLGTVEQSSNMGSISKCNAVIYLARGLGLETLKFIKYLFDLSDDCVKQGRPDFLLTTGDIVIILNKPWFLKE